VVGQTLSHFEIQQKLGQGGMGVVYRALDTRLNRAVAIKVLSPELLRDPGRQQRFVREARAASALNHPNIITIYEIDRDRDADFIAMEYVAGETLDAAVRRGPMRLNEALRCGLQIADALTAAHGAGIVHRDLKPANIMITPAGLVKILDFGVAKLHVPTENLSSPGEVTATLTVGLEPGKVMGTAPYMSPEHLVGRKVDARSDIFSFGTVLYELATGQRAFPGENKVAMAAAVLATEPIAPSEIIPSLPAEFERIVKRCLDKDANRRYQSAGELKVALESLYDALDSGRISAAAIRPPRPRLALGVMMLAGIAAVLGITWMVARHGNPAPPSTMIRLTSDAGLSAYPALSPDGKFVAYASDRAGGGNLDLWLQQIGGGTPIRLTQGEDDSYDPDFSPDGTRIVYRSERDAGGVYMISTLGGESRRIAAEGRHPRFSPDGTCLAWWTGAVGGDLEGAGASKIFVAPLAGTAPVQIRPEFATARAPAWIPDGRRLLFVGEGPGKKYGWWVTPLDGGAAVDTGAYELCVAQRLSPKEGSWAVEGKRVIFAATSGDTKNLWQIELGRDWKAAGAPKRLTFGSGHEVQPSLARGQVAFASLIDTVQVWTLPIDAQGAAAGEPVQLTRGAADNAQVSLSADGRTLAFISYRAGNYDIWLRDMVTRREKRLLETRDNEYYPTLSPDGSKIAWYIERNRQRLTFVMHTAGGTPQQVCNGCGTISSWSADNRRLAYVSVDQPRRAVGVLEVPGGRRTVVLEDPEHSLYQPVFSPDDRWIAFYARLSPSRTQLFVTRFENEGERARQDWIEVTDGASFDAKPRWSQDGNAIYFFSERDRFRCIWRQRLDAKTKRPQGPARAVWHFHNDKRPLMNVAVNALGLAAGPDKIAFNLIEAAGNIWLTGP